MNLKGELIRTMIKNSRIMPIFVVLAVLFSLSALSEDNHIVVANRGAGKYVALTFDDGPHPVYTGEILDILAEYDAKATFFVIGKNAEIGRAHV